MSEIKRVEIPKKEPIANSWNSEVGSRGVWMDAKGTGRGKKGGFWPEIKDRDASLSNGARIEEHSRCRLDGGRRS